MRQGTTDAIEWGEWWLNITTSRPDLPDGRLTLQGNDGSPLHMTFAEAEELHQRLGDALRRVGRLSPINQPSP